MQFNIVIFPPRDQFYTSNIQPAKLICAEKTWSIPLLEERIAKVLNSPKYGYHLAQGKFRLWRIPRDESFDAHLAALQKSEDAIRTAEQKPASDDIEENTGVAFPELCLEWFTKRNIEELNCIYSNTIIVLEQANSKGEFIFKFLKPEKSFLCPSCGKQSPSISSCECGWPICGCEECIAEHNSYHSLHPDAPGKGHNSSEMRLTNASNFGTGRVCRMYLQ